MAGQIVHIEFRSADFGRSAAFYGKIFGWQAQELAASSHLKFQAPGGPGGTWVKSELAQAPGPVAYIAVDSVAGKLAEIEKSGGRILVSPMPSAAGGELALFVDPDGNVVGLWSSDVKGAAAGSGSTSTSSATSPSSSAKSAAPGGKKEAKDPAKSKVVAGAKLKAKKVKR
jgi:predicted enzyme related to lactoylglutathione lyase